MKKIKKVSTNQLVFLLFIAGLSFLLSGLRLNTNFYQNKIYPRTSADNIDISGLTITEAINKLNQNGQSIEPHELKILVDDIWVASSSAELKAYKNYSEIVNTTYSSVRNGSKIQNILKLTKSFFKNTKIISSIRYEDDKLDNLISLLEENVVLEGENPSISLKISGNENSIVVFKGTPGRTLNTINTKENIKNKINDKWKTDNSNDIASIILNVDATVASTSTILSDDQIGLEVNRAKKFVGEKLKLKAENKRYELSDQELVSLIQPLEKFKDKEIEKLVFGWSEEVNRDFQNAEFDYDKDTLEVETFKPHKDGFKMNETDTKKMILDWLENLENKNLEEIESENQKLEDNESSPLEIPLERTSPPVTLENSNDLGIKEKIGFGESYYHHSIINRVHNVGITAERISLTIVPPGEMFSFNKTLGEVSARTGFRSAYVISGGKTILGDGGGVCQVSSTLFRTVLDAGLEVTKRLQHSYRVSYYELNSQPGFDATVYSGDVDFRFTNDTNHHILIYSYVESENRYMNIEIYGTSDGRTTEISNYKKWDYRGPPAAQYYPTPTLPTGVTKQVDWSVSGIKTEFTHTIKDKNGNITNEESYYSNYRPWSAKYMVGI